SRPSLESVADHACAAANIALLESSTSGGIKRREGMLSGQWKADDVAEPAVIGLSHNWQVEQLGGAVAYGQRANGVAHHADLIGVGNADRRAKATLFGDPRKPSHLTVAVERECAGEHIVGPDLGPPWPNRGNAGSDDVRRVLDQRAISNPDTRNVGDALNSPVGNVPSAIPSSRSRMRVMMLSRQRLVPMPPGVGLDASIGAKPR